MVPSKHAVEGGIKMADLAPPKQTCDDMMAARHERSISIHSDHRPRQLRRVAKNLRQQIIPPTPSLCRGAAHVGGAFILISGGLPPRQAMRA